MRLNKFRRNRFAGPVLVVAALLSVGSAFSIASALPSAQKSEVSAQSTLVDEGKQIFLKGCSSCHGLNAEGGAIAPSLIGVGAAAVDFQVGTGRMPMADMSQQAMRKKPVYNAEETAALAAYVASLAPGPAAIDPASLTWRAEGLCRELLFTSEMIDGAVQIDGFYHQDLSIGDKFRLAVAPHEQALKCIRLSHFS